MAKAPAIQADRARSARVGKPGDPAGTPAHFRDSGSRSRRDTFGAGQTLFGSVPYPIQAQPRGGFARIIPVRSPLTNPRSRRGEGVARRSARGFVRSILKGLIPPKQLEMDLIGDRDDRDPGEPVPLSHPDEGAAPVMGEPAADAQPVDGQPIPATPSAADVAWGYVDDQGSIWQRGGLHFPARIVGRLRANNPQLALQAFARRFRGLEQLCADTEAKIGRSAGSGRHLAEVRRLSERIQRADAIGDFDALAGRLEQLESGIVAAQRQQEECKEQLCRRAEELRESTAWKSTAETLRLMQEEWRTLGSAGREKDAALWRRFQTAVGTFFRRRTEDLARRTTACEEAVARKRSLCERAEVLAQGEDWRGGLEFFGGLLAEWRAAGSAGREQDRELWTRLGAARRQYFSRRATHSKQLRRERQDNQERKERLCVEAEELAAAPGGAGALDKLKDLQAQWKTLGPAPPALNEVLWKRFREACGVVYTRVREERERRRVEWQTSLRDAHARKTRQLTGLREAMERDASALDGWRTALSRLRGGSGAEELRRRLEGKLAEVQGELQAKSQRIAELTAALANIDAKLSTANTRRAARPETSGPSPAAPAGHDED